MYVLLHHLFYRYRYAYRPLAAYSALVLIIALGAPAARAASIAPSSNVQSLPAEKPHDSISAIAPNAPTQSIPQPSAPNNIYSNAHNHDFNEKKANLNHRTICRDDNLTGLLHPPPSCNETTTSTTTDQALALYVLSFDNNLRSTLNLAVYAPETMASITSATVGRTDLTVIVLLDEGTITDTRIYQIFDGISTLLPGLPDDTGTLNPTLSEYNATDPVSLGNFIRWARDTYPATLTTFSYIGHNAPLPPETESRNYLESFQGTNAQQHLAATPNQKTTQELFPVPFHKGADADLTDYTDRSLLSTHDLSTALAHGTSSQPTTAQHIATALTTTTNNRYEKFAVVDLISCFSLSLEAIYALRDTTSTIVGSPNYTYFDPNLAGAALREIRPNTLPQAIAANIVNAYDALLPTTGHPRILAAIDTAQVSQIKNSWDVVSSLLVKGLTEDEPEKAHGYHKRLLQAYLNSHKYDSFFCEPPDWRLETPDALVDLGYFAAQLEQQFAPFDPQVSDSAKVTAELLPSAMIIEIHRNGKPWFVHQNVPYWDFDGNAGISLYADFVGVDYQGQTVLNWLAHWYHAQVTDDNPQPYAFLTTSATDKTWADVLTAFWKDTETLQTVVCLPPQPAVQEHGEISIHAIQLLPSETPSGQAMQTTLAPSSPSVPVGSPVAITVTLSNTGELQTLHNVQLTITASLNGTTVFSDVTTIARLQSGISTVSAAHPWVPAKSGELTIIATIDSDDRIIEESEDDNTMQIVGVVSPSLPKPRVTSTPTS